MRSRTAAALVVVVLALVPAAAAQAPSGVVRPTTVKLSPDALRRRAVTCKVPTSSPHLRIKAAANVEIVIDEKGRVRSAVVISGHPLLHASAVRAAGKWTFRPVRVKGRRVAASGILTLVFSPNTDEMERQCESLKRAP
ncbi:MAG: TonB family protein [Pyrinomonadaceae bacterium]